MAKSCPVLPHFALGVLVVAALAIWSVFVGVTDMSIGELWRSGWNDEQVQVLIESRLPRTIALVLAGAAMATSGSILQMLVRNRFAEPSTVGTAEAAKLGFLIVLLLFPEASIPARLAAAAAFAFLTTAFFMRMLRDVPLQSTLVVPLVGILLGGVINAAASFLAYRYDLMQSLASWSNGDFSMILRGRYELLWLSLGMTLLAYVYADRFTVAGLGENISTNLGLRYRSVLTLGLIIVSVSTAVVIVTAGMIPFLGLVVPNLVSLTMGDNVRRTLPWVALLGAGLVLACDIAGRILNAPYEIPVGTMLGVIASGLFLYLLLRKHDRLT
ncbi:MAG: iron chelate uptake ABC transporter family permease subunit [Hyphomicrobium sp.]|jgi:iron complex transport system permease protein|uniref:ABC transporter permease n=1 Tax=Hyphomicrobium sp. TaxID=82 RepID=UPI0025BC91C4|nr:iron chelate uptake ABC transporter family permease subunit [Hyphomicrobium sp.]MBX9864366.1 iron chelate uptake ABC transporter family permease subunit [Hyphomicrobium sp.]